MAWTILWSGVKLHNCKLEEDIKIPENKKWLKNNCYNLLLLQKDFRAMKIQDLVVEHRPQVFTDSFQNQQVRVTIIFIIYSSASPTVVHTISSSRTYTYYYLPIVL